MRKLIIIPAFNESECIEATVRDIMENASDFDYVLIAMDPVYTNRFNKECYNEEKFEWSYYAVPVSELRRHHNFHNRLASNQKILYTDLQQYRVNEEWFEQWEHI